MENTHFGGEEFFINFPEEDYSYATDLIDNI